MLWIEINAKIEDKDFYNRVEGLECYVISVKGLALVYMRLKNVFRNNLNGSIN